MTNTTTPTPTAPATPSVAELRSRAIELGLDPKGLKKADLLAAIATAVAELENTPRSAKAAATRAAKADQALTAWGRADELTEAQAQIINARQLLGHWTDVRDQLVMEAKAADVPISTMADLLGMATPGVRAITLRQNGEG